MTLNQLEATAESVDIAELESLSNAGSINVCAVYSVARPILSGIANFPVLPQKIRAIVQALIAVLDSLCPQ